MNTSGRQVRPSINRGYCPLIAYAFLEIQLQDAAKSVWMKNPNKPLPFAGRKEMTGKLIVSLMALLFGMAFISTDFAAAGFEECGDFTVTLPDGWKYGFSRGVHLFRDSEDHFIDISIEQGRNEPLMKMAKEHGVPVRDLGDVAGGTGEACRFLAAKGDSGTYLEVTVDNAVMKQAPAIIRSLKANGVTPDLQKAMDRVSSQAALDFLK